MRRKGFTLIELLAVIIILGILLLVAIPGVTGYINNSRKNIYVDTAKELIKGTSKLLNSGDFDSLDPNVTYYMDSRCIANESGKEAQSPFGKFNPAYVLVVNENDEYNYYFQSRDETEVGVKDITFIDSLEISKIVSGVKEEDIDTSVGIGNTTKTAVIDQNCNIGVAQPASRRVSKDGESMITLTFDNQGGTGCDMQSQHYGEEWGKLCKPKKEGWKFIGWYTKPNKLGDKITSTTKAEKSMTVYAAWTDQYATFDTGKNFGAKLKQLSGLSGAVYNNFNQNIINIKISEEEPIEANKQEINKVSDPNSAIPIYAWFDTDTIYLWSEDEEPYLNQDASFMFAIYNNLESIEGLDRFDTSKVTSMSHMFWECKKIKYFDVSNWDTSNVTAMNYMFNSCYRIESIDLSNWDTSKVTDMSYMFSSAVILDLDLSSWDTSSVVNLSGMFYCAIEIKSLNLSNFSNDNVESFAYMFYNCNKLKNLVLTNFKTPKATDMSQMFFYCGAENLDLSGFDISRITSLNSMFYNCRNLKTIDLSSFDTSSVTDMGRLFGYCNYLTDIDVSGFDTSNVTDMFEMFFMCNYLKTIDLSNFNTSKVTNMSGMFHFCEKLTSIDVSYFDTSNVYAIGSNYDSNGNTVDTQFGMFELCRNLTSINLSTFDTTNLKYMGRLFYGCEKLEVVEFGNINTSKVESIAMMFYLCKKISVIDLSAFNTNNIKYVHYMFRYCENLTTIYVNNNFDVSNAILYYDLFERCNSLVGGSGTQWTSSMASDLTKAQIDGGTSNPGLFTLKV